MEAKDDARRIHNQWRSLMPQLVSTDEIIEAYRATGSVWKAGKRLGICGQSVWERLTRHGYKLPGSKWTEEERNELRRLAGTCPLAEIARRLGRPYGSVAGVLSSMGISGRSSAKKVSLRGTGLTKTAIKQLVSDLNKFDGTISQFCRQRGISIDLFIKATQKYQNVFWMEYTQRVGLESKECEYCKTTFYPLSAKQRTCSRKCQSHARTDRQYFAGKRRSTIGLAEGICQLCEQEKSSLASHHVWGKENDPDGTFLIALCNGCHQLVSHLASRKLSGDAGFLERLIVWSNMRRHGNRKPSGFHCYVDFEELTDKEINEDVW